MGDFCVEPLRELPLQLEILVPSGHNRKHEARDSLGLFHRLNHGMKIVMEKERTRLEILAWPKP
ncbi:hypothetical protein OIU79_009367 [Salix purpurea]|uniref:Uncharacterized protein n=1 Tax=Salix purpurea TaxID=77065 RepID=A0A9Q0TKN1_SALPP|nr:hypothetical protein OIU79_009367 [Salix purpurea]